MVHSIEYFVKKSKMSLEKLDTEFKSNSSNIYRVMKHDLNVGKTQEDIKKEASDDRL